MRAYWRYLMRQWDKSHYDSDWQRLAYEGRAVSLETETGGKTSWYWGVIRGLEPEISHPENRTERKNLLTTDDSEAFVARCQALAHESKTDIE